MNKNKPKLTKPQVGGDINVWGYILNENIDKIELFTSSVYDELVSINEETSKLQNTKLDKDQIETEVSPVVNNYVEKYAKPNIDSYIEENKGNLKGEDAKISKVSASVNSLVGTPRVIVTLGGTESNRTFDFKFLNLKGEKGHLYDLNTNSEVFEWFGTEEEYNSIAFKQPFTKYNLIGADGLIVKAYFFQPMSFTVDRDESKPNTELNFTSK